MAKNAGIMLRAEPALIKKFHAALETDARIHNFEQKNASAQIRDLMRDFITRVESTAASAVAVEAGAVLGRKRRG